MGGLGGADPPAGQSTKKTKKHVANEGIIPRSPHQFHLVSGKCGSVLEGIPEQSGDICYELVSHGHKTLVWLRKGS